MGLLVVRSRRHVKLGCSWKVAVDEEAKWHTLSQETYRAHGESLPFVVRLLENEGLDHP